MKFIKKYKIYILVSILFAVVIESLALLASCSGTDGLDTELLGHNMTVFAGSLWIRLAIIAILGILTFTVIFGIKSDVINTWMDSVSKRLEIRLDKRNHNAIYQALGIPLYDVLSAHSGEFGVSVTSFKSILTNGDYFRVKNGEWHYKYQVIAPSVPKFYNADLRGIIQAYIYQEIQLGMWGLNAFYNDEYSVYITKAYYDKAGHKMVIELFYVDSDRAYQYLKELKAHTEYHGAHEKENRQLLLSMSRKGIL
ncbi:MAG: hypothetical protein IJ639_12625 [Ruminococcus sp.]|nr:hypothetical protein [Ruminococcus sp.]